MQDDVVAQMHADRAQLAVARTVPRSVVDVLTVLSAWKHPDYPYVQLRAGDDAVELDLRWHRGEWRPLGLADLAPGFVQGTWQRRRGRDCRIEIECNAWSRTMTELVVRPVVSRPSAWSLRRRAHWFAAAHAVGDELRSRILATAVPENAFDREPAAPFTHARRAG